jgi:glutaredoxin 3
MPPAARQAAILNEVEMVTVYTTEHCSRCVSAKTLLGRRGIAYEEINLAKDPDGRAKLQERTGMVTFPQIVIGGKTLGGFDELLAADRAGRLKELTAAA